MKIPAALLLAFALLLAGCSGPERVSMDEFKREYAAVGQISSLRKVDYLGVQEGRALIKVGSMRLVGGGWKEKTIYVDLTEVDPVFRAALTKGQGAAVAPR